MIMHHIVHCIDRVYSLFADNCPLLVDVASTTPSGKQPIDHSDTNHVLASVLVYCINTTRSKLLCATVVEPLSSA